MRQKTEVADAHEACGKHVEQGETRHALLEILKAMPALTAKDVKVWPPPETHVRDASHDAWSTAEGMDTFLGGDLFDAEFLDSERR